MSAALRTPPKVVLSVPMSPALRTKLTRAAAKVDISVVELMRRAGTAYADTILLKPGKP